MSQDNPSSAHLAIADYVMEKIVNDEIRPGEKVPSLNQLCDQFKVDKNVVRRALTRLENLGWVIPMRGKGSFVKAQPQVVTSILTRRNRYTTTISRMGVKPKSQLLEWCLDDPTAKEREGLELKEEERVFRLETLRFAGSKPFARGTSTLPEKAVPGLERYLDDFQSLHGLLKEHYSIDPIRKYSIIETRMPLNRDAEMLQMPENIPIMLTTSVNLHPDGIPVELSVSRVRGDLIQYVVDFENIEPKTVRQELLPE